MRRENIFEAHRTHYYQFLANEKKWPHVMVSILFAAMQLVLNYVIIHHHDVAYLLFVGMVLMYAGLRRADILNAWRTR
jgi:O-antigen/teichoic acid export membrane protein